MAQNTQQVNAHSPNQSSFDPDLRVGGTLRTHVPGKTLLTLGYTGYIPSVKAENLFGRTYGNLTNVVKANQILHQNCRTKAVFDDYDDDYTALHAYNFNEQRRKENR